MGVIKINQSHERHFIAKESLSVYTTFQNVFYYDLPWHIFFFFFLNLLIKFSSRWNWHVNKQQRKKKTTVRRKLYLIIWFFVTVHVKFHTSHGRIINKFHAEDVMKFSSLTFQIRWQKLILFCAWS